MMTRIRRSSVTASVVAAALFAMKAKFEKRSCVATHQKRGVGVVAKMAQHKGVFRFPSSLQNADFVRDILSNRSGKPE